MKRYLNKNVYEATQERLDYIFKEFDNIYISFSGGKDSGVLVNLVIDYMKQNNIKKKIGLFHQDTECCYSYTVDYVTRTFLQHRDYIDPYWFCVESLSRNALSITEPYWIAWDKTKKDLWVRNYPDLEFIYKENPFKTTEILHYKEHFKKFSQYYHKKNKAKKTICLTGVRSDESLRRYNSIVNSINFYKDTITNESKNYIMETNKNIYSAKPIYDWRTQDIWVANGRYKYDYNKLYDLFFKAGVSFDNMRVATPFVEEGQGSLNLYRVIDPNIWQKFLLRVGGVNFGAIYGGTKAFGSGFTLPINHTWKSYTKFLLNTLPKDIRDHYIKHFKTSIRFWHKHGGGLRQEYIDKLKENNIPIRENGISPYSTKNKLTKIVVKKYPDSIDFINSWDIPSYKRMAIAILKNDYSCRTLGFGQTKDSIFKQINKITTIGKWK